MIKYRFVDSISFLFSLSEVWAGETRLDAHMTFPSFSDQQKLRPCRSCASLHGLAELFGPLRRLDLVSWLNSHKLIWRTYYRGFIFKSRYDLDDVRPYSWIVYVVTVPGQQELHAVDCSNSDV